MRTLFAVLVFAGCAAPPSAPICHVADTTVVRLSPTSWRVESCGRELCSAVNDPSTDAQAIALCRVFREMTP